GQIVLRLPDALAFSRGQDPERMDGLPQMPKRQRRSCLERLDGNVASDLADNRQVQEFADEEALIVFQVWHDHLQEIISLTRNQMTADYLRHRTDRLFEFDGALIGVAVDLHADEDGEAEADPVASQRSTIALDVSFRFEPLHPTATSPPCRQALRC